MNIISSMRRSSRPKYLELGFLDFHDITGEAGRYLDDGMVSVLQRMDKRGDLDDTTITIYSDHGLYLNFFYYVTQETSMYMELRLPTLLMGLPREAADKYGEILKENE